MNLAVGFFDGVHLGHRRILAQADAALTFLDHPAAVLAPDRVPPLLMPTPLRLAAIAAALGGHASNVPAADRVRALPFTRELAAQPPDVFAAWLRTAYPRLSTLFCGSNWTFGAHGAGSAETLRASGFSVEVVPFVLHDGVPVSSTRIRMALAAGRVEDAKVLLGRPYELAGTVVSGKGLGRSLGFPTINIVPPPELVKLPLGVYAVHTPLGHGVANYGHAPTLGERAWNAPLLEVHLTDQTPGAFPMPDSLSVAFLRFIRPEQKFESLAALAEQIARDVREARESTI